jgi:hypothetical protein
MSGPEANSIDRGAGVFFDGVAAVMITGTIPTTLPALARQSAVCMGQPRRRAPITAEVVAPRKVPTSQPVRVASSNVRLQ